jgi:Zn-dependent peptidase ImmA (M78 family)
MHIGTLNRAVPSCDLPIYKHPEWQANRFAAALLMPRAHVSRCDTIAVVMTTFVVSGEAAAVRFKSLGLGKTN